MARWTASLHPRGPGGKFRRKPGARKQRKANRLRAKNDRIVRQYARDRSLHGTPLGYSIERSVVNRAYRIAKLEAEAGRARANRTR